MAFSIGSGATPSIGQGARPTFSVPSIGSGARPTFSSPSIGTGARPTFTAPAIGSGARPSNHNSRPFTIDIGGSSGHHGHSSHHSSHHHDHHHHHGYIGNRKCSPLATWIVLSLFSIGVFVFVILLCTTDIFDDISDNWDW